MSVAFDTLAYANKLKSVGFETKQAETIVEMQADIIENNLATKRDLKELEQRLFIRLGSLVAGAVVLTAALVKML